LVILDEECTVTVSQRERRQITRPVSTAVQSARYSGCTGRNPARLGCHCTQRGAAPRDGCCRNRSTQNDAE